MHRGVPHRELPDESRQQRTQRQFVVDALDRDLDRRVEHVVGEALDTREHLSDQPDVVLDHANEQIHRRHLSVGRDAQASRRVEVHLARRVDLESRRLPPPARRRLTVCASEGARERLVRRVARLERDLQHVLFRRDQPIGRTLEQDAATQSRGRLAGGSRHEPVEVKPRDVDA